MYDLHTHSLFSDGELLPIELVRRAAVLGYTTLGITDHVDASNIKETIAGITRIRKSAECYGVDLLPGVEITHVPPEEIHSIAQLAVDEGAEVVVVHGETTVEPVAPGTNLAACTCSNVSILAHPGFLTEQEAEEAEKNGVAIELTARGGHNRTNGHVLQVARAAGCRMVVSSDGHAPQDLMSQNTRVAVARGAGMTEDECRRILEQNITDLLARR